MISPANKCDSFHIAKLHHQTISDGFLSKLGVSFLQSLYLFLINKELVLVYKKENRIFGFVSCAISSAGIMKRFLFASPSGIFKIVIAFLKNPKIIKPLLETYRAPSLSESNSVEENEIPETELLSISVSPLSQNGGIGTQILLALENELKKKCILRYKVIVGEKLEGANNFYQKNGFVLSKQICIHGRDVSNIYIKEIQ